MPRKPDDQRRADLLAAVIASCAENGIGNRSLRDIADSVGTSHRMLLHHFGSREELLVAIVETIEARQVGELDTSPQDPAGAFEHMWRSVRNPSMWPFERLFFECYARGAQGEEPFSRLLPVAVRGWLREVAARAETTADPALTRLALATVRGLLLDLVGTQDRKAVDAAADTFVRLLRCADHIP